MSSPRPRHLLVLRPALAAAGAIAVALAAPSARADDFSTGLDNWVDWTNFQPGSCCGGLNYFDSYATSWNQNDGNPPGSICVSGDGFGTDHGFEKTFTGVQQFAVSFDWRSRSSNAADTANNMSLLIVRVSDGAILYNLPLLQGTILDSGWRTFPTTNLSFVLGVAAPPTDISVRFSVHDAWYSNWNESICLDNFIFTTSPPPPPNVPVLTDDFTSSLDGWQFWTDDNPSQNSPWTYTLKQDTTQGNPAPSANVWGTYTYNGNSRFSFGMQKTINVVNPFVLSFDRQNATPLGFQIYDTSGQLRSSMFLPPTAANTFESYGPVDVTPTVAGLSQVIVRFSQLGNSSTNSGFWIDNFSYSTSCTNAPDGTACSDDGNPCTDDVCQAGQCTHPDNGTCVDAGAADAGTPGNDAGVQDAAVVISQDASSTQEAGSEDGGTGTFQSHGCSCDLAGRSGSDRRGPLALGGLVCGAFLLLRRRRAR